MLRFLLMMAGLAAGAPIAAAQIGVPARADSAPRPAVPPVPPVATPSSAAAAYPQAFDSPATGALVDRTIATMGRLPAELNDYRVGFRSELYLAVAVDSGFAGELPATADEFQGEAFWDRSGSVVQTIRGQRVSVAVPTVATLGSLVENPWIVPHLYGAGFDIFRLTTGGAATPGTAQGDAVRTFRAVRARAVHPFGPEGPRFYRFRAEDTVRVGVGTNTLTLIGMRVEPRDSAPDARTRLVTGTFYVDQERAALARARFGFTEPGGGLAGTSATFFELENGLVQGRFWLPRWQRIEVQGAFPLLGASTAARIITEFDRFRLNTGWTADRPGQIALRRELAPGDSLRWSGPVGGNAGRYTAGDFADLGLAVAAAEAGPASRFRTQVGPNQLALAWERTDHLFRYNRVEGLYLGVGARLQPPNPARRWSVYGTGGYAFAEGVPRGELSARWRNWVWRDTTRLQPEYSGALFRRLLDTRTFRPAFDLDIGYSGTALLGGFDPRDYYDAQGGEASVRVRRGGLMASLGGRVERHDSVSRNTDSYLFGDADGENWDAVAPADPGTHVGLEGEVRLGRGSGAFGIGNSSLAILRAEQGVGDFGFGRAVATLSSRRYLGPVSLALRGDAAHAWGEVPTQRLVRFGVGQGLQGYDTDDYGGTTALAGRARLVLGIPPRSAQPISLGSGLILPPLRPALVAIGEIGTVDVDPRNRAALARIGARPSDGALRSVGFGVSFLDDIVVAEYLIPMDGEDRKGRWYVGLNQFF